MSLLLPALKVVSILPSLYTARWEALHYCRLVLVMRSFDIVEAMA